MLKNLKPKSEFSRNVLTLMTGTTIAQAIPIAISPILTRIYTPEDFGVYALFIAITTIFGSIACGRYELAIMLPKKDEDAINIVALGFIITSFLSFILLVLVIVFNSIISNMLNNQNLKYWLYFVPLVVFFIGCFNVLNYFNTRIKNYKDLANSTIIKSIVLAAVQLFIGFLKTGVTGLITGQIFSQIFANLRLLKNVINNKNLISKINLIKMQALAKRYKKFPLFSSPAIMANILSIHLTNILISTFYDIATLGFYSFVQRILGMPSVLIGSSISQVFFQEASKEKERTGKAIKTLNKTVKKLIIIGLPIFVVIYFTVEQIFAFIFGEEWRIAGEYAKILIPLFFARFVVATVSVINPLFEKQLISFFWQTSLFLSSFFSIYLSNLFGISFLRFIYIYMGVMTTNYFALYFIIRNVANKTL